MKTITKFKSDLSKAWLGFMAMILATALTSTAQADTDADAEAFISNVTKEAVTILQDEAVPAEDRNGNFADFVLSHADTKAIGFFTLGNNRRVATEAELDEFNGLFQAYSRNFYATRLAEYAAQELTVTGSLVRSAKDVIVMSSLEDAEGGEPIPVNWRLRKADGKYSLRDLEVLGIWIALEQRSQFNSIIANNGGKVSALLTELRNKVESGEAFEPDSAEASD